MSSGTRLTYDDCLCQLDDSLVKLSGDPEESVVHFALHGHRAKQMEAAFFEGNPFAESRIERYLDAGSGKPRGRAAEIIADPAQRERLRAVGAEDPRLRFNLAALFRYHKPGQPDPDPVAALQSHSRHSRGWPLDQVAWMVKRLREEFGDHCVRLDELRRPKDNWAIYVFDRSARRWWRQLPLGHRDWFFRWRKGPNTRAALEAWIEETKAQFERKRSNLRVPKR